MHKCGCTKYLEWICSGNSRLTPKVTSSKRCGVVHDMCHGNDESEPITREFKMVAKVVRKRKGHGGKYKNNKRTAQHI